MKTEPPIFFKDLDRPFVFGHRGYNARALENTIGSFDLCRTYGIRGIELDVHMCKSGEIVVIHDHNLFRLAKTDATVEQLPWDTLKDLTLRRDDEEGRIPLLEQVFSRYGNSFYYDIELKLNSVAPTGIIEKTLDLIDRYDLADHVMISSFNPFILRAWNRKTDNAFSSGIIYSRSDDVPWILHNGQGRFIANPTYMKPHHSLIDRNLMGRLHDRNKFPIVAWTVNTKDECERLLEFDIDGFISDDPLEVIHTVRASKGRG